MKEQSDTKHFGLFMYAGHGMIKNGSQYILLNQYDEKNGFYYMHPVETQIRTLSKNFLNCYIVAIFACCRQNFSPGIHQGFVGRKFAEAELEKRDSIVKTIEFLKISDKLSDSEDSEDEIEKQGGIEQFI